MARWNRLSVRKILGKKRFSQHSSFWVYDFSFENHISDLGVWKKKKANGTCKFQIHPKHANHRVMRIFALACCFYVTFTSYLQKLRSGSTSYGKTRVFMFLVIYTETRHICLTKTTNFRKNSLLGLSLRV